jgi:hypothetical protein
MAKKVASTADLLIPVSRVVPNLRLHSMDCAKTHAHTGAVTESNESRLKYLSSRSVAKCKDAVLGSWSWTNTRAYLCFLLHVSEQTRD